MCMSTYNIDVYAFVLTCNIIMLTCKMVIFTYDLNNVVCQHYYVKSQDKIIMLHVDIIYLASRRQK